MRVTYDEEKDEVLIEILAGQTRVEHRMKPEDLENLEYDVQRAMALSGVRPRDYMLDDEEESEG